MSKERTEAYAGHEAKFSAILADYLLAVDQGAPPDRQAFLSAHPKFADCLRTFFAGQDQVEALATPLRTAPGVPPMIGAYDLTEEIGRGGMGMVLRGRDRILNRELAVKVLLDCYRDRPDLVRRFVEEAQITGQLQHPYIVPIHELGILPDGRPFFAMKLIKGRTFAELLADRQTPGHDAERCLHIFEQVCQTIAYAHSKGVIHRDLKPANVMVGAFGEVQVMDWGLAKVLDDQALADTPVPEAPLETIRVEEQDSNTDAGMVLGTLAFMPPEQAAGLVDQVDRRSDVFGLGAILCNVLTGQPPYIGEPADVREQARHALTAAACTRLDACGADSDLVALARRCLAAEPAERPGDAAAVADALAAHFTAVRERLRLAEIARATAEAKAVAEAKRARAEARRRRATLIMAASLLLLLGVTAGVVLWVQQQQARRSAEFAARRADTERDVTAALREVTLLQEEGLRQADDPERWRQTLALARAAYQRAENALNLGESSEALREQVATARAALAADDQDCKLLADLDRVMDDYTNNANGNVIARAARAYERAFREHGLPLQELPSAEAAQKLTAHRLRGRLQEAMENWAYFVAIRTDGGEPVLNAEQTGAVFLPRCDWSRAGRLLEILEAAEPDAQSFRRRWRQARSQNQTAVLLKMAEAPEVLTLGPLGIVNLASDLRVAGDLSAEIRLLRKGLDKYQDHYLLYAGLGNALQSLQAVAAPEAVHYLTAAVALRSRSPNSHVWLSMALDRAGDMPAALREARRAIAVDPRSVDAWQWLGIVLLKGGVDEEVIACLEKAVALDETADKAHGTLGAALISFGKVEAGLQHLRRAVELDPKHGAHHYNLAAAWRELGQTRKAIECYRRAIELVPVDALARIHLAGLLMTTGDSGTAIGELEQGVAKMPRNPDLYFALAEIHAQRGETAKALACMQTPAEQNPRSAYAQIKLSEFLMQRDAHGALAAARKAFAIEQQPDMYITLLRALLKTGATLEARQTGEEALRRFPRDAALHDTFGTVLYWQGELGLAMAEHQLAIDLAPRQHVYHENLGLALRAVGQFEKAEKAFRTTILLKSNRSGAHQLLADILSTQGRYDEAMAAAEKAIACNPRNISAYLSLVMARAEKGEFAEATKALRRMEAILPSGQPRPDILQNMATVLDDYARAGEKLPNVLAGKHKPATASENLRYGVVCCQYHRKRHALAGVTFLTDAFAQDPRLAEGTLVRPRYAAILGALCAATGRSEDAAKLSDAQRAELRQKALAWLRTELLMLDRPLSLNPNDRASLFWMLQQWERHPDLADVRDEQALQALPAAERRDWIAFWEAVAGLRKRAAQ